MQFIVNGRLVDLDSAPKPVKRKAQKEAPEEWHKGWIVAGHRPGECAEAEKKRAAEVFFWESLSDEDRSDAMKDGKRAPKPWNEDEWRRMAPKHSLRRPFAIESAAEEMKLMAERAGWEDVEVTELARRKGQD